MERIDINFDVYSDTPVGKDPDTFSKTLRQYHKLLWSKPLPVGFSFELNDSRPKVLFHTTINEEFVLSSDSIGHSYSTTKSTRLIIEKIPPNEVADFFKTCSTIGAYILFPANKINNKMTINGARGLNAKIKDRFDLTLECIKRYYDGITNPLSHVLDRYASFFHLFVDFRGYVEFFLLQDLVTDDTNEVKFFLPFHEFEGSPIPKSVDEYLEYKSNVIKFINSRNYRIANRATNTF